MVPLKDTVVESVSSGVVPSSPPPPHPHAAMTMRVKSTPKADLIPILNRKQPDFIRKIMAPPYSFNCV
jgi:hypothetical protein